MEHSKKEEIVGLAKRIIELDIERDEIWEELTRLTGAHAHEILRYLQNS
ncbi:hypothetical protein HPB58_07450 [Priestia filamentosa]|nr:hypothetical protein [Priestia filamentosa]UOE61997.1 hypothetical protein HPB58_07450 [Priestia filamentosa]